MKGFVSPTVKFVPHAVFLQTTGRDFTSGDILARSPVVRIPGHRVRILERFVFIFFSSRCSRCRSCSCIDLVMPPPLVNAVRKTTFNVATNCGRGLMLQFVILESKEIKG